MEQAYHCNGKMRETLARSVSNNISLPGKVKNMISKEWIEKQIEMNHLRLYLLFALSEGQIEYKAMLM
jgi:hypothetical protein